MTVSVGPTPACNPLPARRAIYAGIGDRLVPVEHPRALSKHWGRPRIAWMQSAHDPRTPEARRLVDETLRASLADDRAA